MSSEFLCQDLEAKLFNWFAGRLDASLIKRESKMKIQVEIKDVYGAMKVYPVCQKAKLFAKIAGTKTLTEAVLKDVERLGYQLEVIVSPKYLELVGSNNVTEE